MGDDLQDKPRKELKELCSRNNIRTAGVKHEDLVRLLRNKLYPSAPSTPRSTSLKSARAPKEPSPVNDTNADSYKTPVKTGGNKPRNTRTPPTLPRENEKSKEFQRKNWGLSRKPLVTKSNTFSSRTRVDGWPKKDQENAHARTVASRVKGILSPLSRRSVEAPETMSIQIESPQLEDDSASDASRRVSEVATDAGPDTMSDFSDADEFRSVSSEPVSSRLGKRASSLRTEASLLSAQSGLSFFTAGSWSSENSRSLENLRGEDVFPELPDGSDFLGDALEMSFLDAGAADPEAVAFTAMHSPMARDYVNYNRGSETDPLDRSAASEEGKHPSDMEFGETSESGESKDLVASKNDLTPEVSGDTAKEGREDDHIASEEGRHPRDMEVGETSQGRESRDSDLAPGASGDMAKADREDDRIASEEGEHPRGTEFGETSQGEEPKDLVPSKNDLAPGASGDTAKEDCEDDRHVKSADVEGWAADTPTECEPCAREDAVTQPTPEDEVHSGLAEGEESGSPAFDYSVPKKLEFEPVEITSVPPAERDNDESESQKIGPAETVNPSDSTPTNAEEAAEEPGCSVDEREGSDAKSGDEVRDYKKPVQDGREKEDVQATLSFPLSIIFWCSQLCSSTSGSRTRTLTS